MQTTLVALLQRLYDPTSGAILLDGQDLTTIDAAWFRSQIGVVSQVRLFVCRLDLLLHVFLLSSA
jgi:ABC-type multidrug transport system fused ATPase/permease subunit